MKAKKTAALLLGAAIIATGLTACGEGNPLKSSTTDKKVARPDPATESPIPKIKTGSSRMFMIAPSNTELMAIKECPCVRIKGFSPWDSITKTVPQA